MKHDGIFEQHHIDEELVNSLFVCEVLESSELISHELKNYQEKLEEHNSLNENIINEK